VKDLTTFLDIVRQERPHDIVDVYHPVNPEYETAAIITKLEQAYRSPIVVFHQVNGSCFPLVTNVCGSWARIALALGCSVRELPQCYADRCARPIKAVLTPNARVHECVLTGKAVDLSALPQLIYHENDVSRPYVTGAIVVARDPDTGKSNLSFHRLMILDRNTTGIFMARGKHLHRIYCKYEAADQPMPIAAFIGVHPVCSLGGVYTGSHDTQEYDIIGGLQQSSLSLVKCVTNCLCVPAESEFALEGTIPPGRRVEEGPFGEFTGYSTGTMACPMLKVDAITFRKQPLFQDIVSGGLEHLLLPVLGMEYHLLEIARAAVTNTKSVKLSVPLTAFVSLEKSEAAQPRRIIEALLSSDVYIKQVIVVDAEVDLSDLRQVATAVALHLRPDRDIYIHSRMPGTELDPSGEVADGLTSKLGLDATQRLKAARPIAKNRVPQHLLDSINVSELLGVPSGRLS
jgi:2,5-furandicarboxylate decarboxylase 1